MVSFVLQAGAQTLTSCCYELVYTLGAALDVGILQDGACPGTAIALIEVSTQYGTQAEVFADALFILQALAIGPVRLPDQPVPTGSIILRQAFGMVRLDMGVQARQQLFFADCVQGLHSGLRPGCQRQTLVQWCNLTGDRLCARRPQQEQVL